MRTCRGPLHFKHGHLFFAIRCAIALLTAAPFDCLAAPSDPPDLANASVEDLLNVQVTSVSKKEQNLSNVGAAAFVLGSEDIRRSGATNIPDLLRLVPGVDVAQIDGHTWAITIRGFNGTYANKVLVLIDGRSVYSALTSGVNWDQQDVPLEDIDRIEVIRGPGGTIWGANAVNGVINIITKQADASKGGLVVAGGGSHDTARDLAQYGGNIGSLGSYRVFGTYSGTMSSQLPGGFGAGDGWHMTHFGGRSDWTVSPGDNLTLQGDLSKMDSSQDLQIGATQLNAGAANILGRWTRTLDSGSDLTLQAWFDHYNRLQEDLLSEFRNTVDLDFHHHLKLANRHDVIWGLGYRVTGDRTVGSAEEFFSPASQVDNLFSIFVQDEVALNRSISITIGSKIEHNAYTGFEFAPSAQFVWRPDNRQQVWASVSQAVREPSRSDVGVTGVVSTFPVGNGYGAIEAYGSLNQPPEKLRDFELGYRVEAGRRFSLDIATFYGFFRNLSQGVPGTPYFTGLPQPILIEPVYFKDQARGRSYGGEAFATWRVTNRWRLIPGFSFSHVEITEGLQERNGNGNSGATTPGSQFRIRSQLDLPRRVELDTTLAYTAALDDIAGSFIPPYTRLDMRIGRTLGERTEISVVGQNLLTPRHAEFPDDLGVSHVLVPRGVFARLTFRF